MRRRDFLAVLGAAAWPCAARAQQPAMPVVGFINSASPRSYARPLAAFLKGLGETGYVDGRNVLIEYRWAEDRIDRLPAMAAELVSRHVAVIAATSTQAALAAKAATATIPIVFELAGDPVKQGLVDSLSRPGGNVTGVTQLNVEVAPKRLELLHELLPTATVVALLVNPANPALADPAIRELQAAARTLGLQIHILNARSEPEFEAVFANAIRLRAAGLVIVSDPFFTGRAEQLAALAARHAVAAIYSWREFAAAGGLVSYGSDVTDAYRLAGVYTGRILNGAKPPDLPIQQATKLELIINLKTAKSLGITVPLSLLARADEVIE
jgi:putative ABC transport system substrate-binding protein